jgi:hypothetical protein
MNVDLAKFSVGQFQRGASRLKEALWVLGRGANDLTVVVGCVM